MPNYLIKFATALRVSTGRPFQVSADKSVEVKDRQASVLKTQDMTVAISVEDGESIEFALRKLNKKVKHETDRFWHKRRLGYYEKPSILKRKAKKDESAFNTVRW